MNGFAFEWEQPGLWRAVALVDWTLFCMGVRWPAGQGSAAATAAPETFCPYATTTARRSYYRCFTIHATNNLLLQASRASPHAALGCWSCTGQQGWLGMWRAQMRGCPRCFQTGAAMLPGPR